MAAPSAEQRRQDKRDDTRRTILDATEAILADSGYGGFSMRRLSERCGYTAPSIYHHFGDKTGLLDALLELRFQELLRLLSRVRESTDPLETIRERARAFVRFGVRNPAHYRILTLEREDAEPLPAIEQARTFLERPWRQLSEAGRLAVSDIGVAQRAAFALLHGLISLRSGRPDLDWPRGIFEECIDAMLRGLVIPAATNPTAPPEGSSA